jgi:L-ascorbate metabolism protein UlaG (beta-lactamase superfamily)
MLARHPTADALGFVVEGTARLYFAGDTDLFEDMACIGADGLDVALIPIWGWGTSIGPGHMDPERAAHAAALLRPRVAVPVHWGTFLPVGLRRRHGALLHAPAGAFADRVAELAPSVRTRILRQGEVLEV